MKLSRTLVPVSLVLATTSLVACVYSSDAPIPNSSGKGTTASSDGTDPGGSDGGDTTGDSGGNTGGNGTDAGQQTFGGADAGATGGKDAGTVTSTAPTWTTIYTSYFAAASIGRCGASGCHLSTKSGFKCGSDKTTCYNGLVSSGYVDTKNPAASLIADAQQSCLVWFGGNMPPSNGSSSKAAADITAWVKDGAKNN